jgi:hypothetical protein
LLWWEVPGVPHRCPAPCTTITQKLFQAPSSGSQLEVIWQGLEIRLSHLGLCYWQVATQHATVYRTNSSQNGPLTSYGICSSCKAAWEFLPVASWWLCFCSLQSENPCSDRLHTPFVHDIEHLLPARPESHAEYAVVVRRMY